MVQSVFLRHMVDTIFYYRMRTAHGTVARHMAMLAERFHDASDTLQNHGGTRLAAITRWLKSHHRGEAFVVIGDRSSGTGLIGSRRCRNKRVVFCELDVGAYCEQVAPVISALNCLDQQDNTIKQTLCTMDLNDPRHPFIQLQCTINPSWLCRSSNACQKILAMVYFSERRVKSIQRSTRHDGKQQ